MAVKQVQVFSLPTEYERQAAEARRREMMAQMLAQQEYDPGQYAGAPIPKAAPVVKALEGYLKGRELRKAREASERAEGEVSRAGEQITGYLFGGGRMPKTAADLTEVVPAGRLPAPNEADLTEVVPEGAYTKPYPVDPTAALRAAMTPAGAAAMRGNPALAAMLAKTMEKPEAEEFYAPTETEGGLVQFGKRGGRRDTGVRAAPKPPETTTTQRDYEFARSQGYQGSFEDFRKSGTPKTTVDVRYGAPVAGVDAQGNPVFFQPNPTGGPPSIISGVAPKPEAMGVNEANAALFADRASQANPVFDQIPAPSLAATAKGEFGGVGNMLLTPENRQFFQAERNFITAILRKESGASIPPNEYGDARRVYIPQAGDDPKTLEMKRQARANAIAGIARGAGPNYKVPSTSKNDEIVDLPPRRR